MIPDADRARILGIVADLDDLARRAFDRRSVEAARKLLERCVREDLDRARYQGLLIVARNMLNRTLDELADEPQRVPARGQ